MGASRAVNSCRFVAIGNAAQILGKHRPSHDSVDTRVLHLAVLPRSDISNSEDIGVGDGSLMLIDRDKARFIHREASCTRPIRRTASKGCNHQVHLAKRA